MEWLSTLDGTHGHVSNVSFCDLNRWIEVVEDRVQIHDTSRLSVVETGVARGATISVHSCTDRYVILNPPEVLV